MQSEFPGVDTLAQALPLFYQKYDLSEDGGLSDSTVKIVFYKNIYAYIPNIDARRKCVLKHDIHHIVTGYKIDFKGETEIAAWEIASGCRKYWVALILDMSGMAIGFWFNLPAIFRAFIRGRRTKNLYSDFIPDQQAIAMTVNEMREKLGLNIDSNKPASFSEVISFMSWYAISGIYSVLSILFLPAMVLYTIFVAATKKQGTLSPK